MRDQPKNFLFSNRDIFHLVGPLVISLALELVVGLIDSIMVSSVGEAAVSGVSLVDSVMQLLIYIFAAIASGGAAVAGQYLGARQPKKARQAAGELLRLNLLLSMVVTALMLFTSSLILSHLFGHIEAEVYYHARRYFLVVIISIPAIGIFEAGTAVFRTMGDSKTTMKLSVFMNVVNGIGNAVLIYVCDMGTQGAAISTLLSRWLAAVFIVILLLKPGRELSLEQIWRHRFDGQMFRSILRVGIPGGVENGIFQLGKIVILGLVTTFGTSAITANSVTQTMASLEMIPGSAVQLAAVTIISRCIGAGNYEQTRYYNRKLLRIAYFAVWAWSFLLVLSLPAVLSLYHLSDETAELMTAMFLWHTLGAVSLWPLAFDLPASLRAAGDVRFPMLVSVFSMWVFRFGGAYLLARVMGIGVIGVWISMAILDWGFRAAVYLTRWNNGKWKTKVITAEQNKVYKERASNK